MALEDGRSSGTGSDYLVRRLRPDEWPDLRTLRLRALADAPDAFGKTLAEAETELDASWQQQASADDRVVIVAEAGGRLVGMASGGRAPTPKADRDPLPPPLFDEPAASLSSMWVEPAARRTGVAAAMVAAIVQWALEAEYQVLLLGVTTSNASAIALYERLGFADTGRRFHLPARSDLEMQLMVRTLA